MPGASSMPEPQHQNFRPQDIQTPGYGGSPEIPGILSSLPGGRLVAQPPRWHPGPAQSPPALISAVPSASRQEPVDWLGTNRHTAATRMTRRLTWIFTPIPGLWHETSVMPSRYRTSCAAPTPRTWRAFGPKCACPRSTRRSKTGRLPFQWTLASLRLILMYKRTH